LPEYEVASPRRYSVGYLSNETGIRNNVVLLDKRRDKEKI
jgi:hypothetical protein